MIPEGRKIDHLELITIRRFLDGTFEVSPEIEGELNIPFMEMGVSSA